MNMLMHIPISSHEGEYMNILYMNILEYTNILTLQVVALITFLVIG